MILFNLNFSYMFRLLKYKFPLNGVNLFLSDHIDTLFRPAASECFHDSLWLHWLRQQKTSMGRSGSTPHQQLYWGQPYILKLSFSVFAETFKRVFSICFCLFQDSFYCLYCPLGCTVGLWIFGRAGRMSESPFTCKFLKLVCAIKQVS